MKRTCASLLVVVCLAMSACAEDTEDPSRYAIDSDGSGSVDCADLDHVLACLHHPGSDVCAEADVNHDGVVDDADVHDLHAGLEATGHHCDEPPHHHEEGDHDDHPTDEPVGHGG
jgi:hypothetical protein